MSRQVVDSDTIPAVYQVYVDGKDVTSSIFNDINIVEQEDYMVSATIQFKGSTIADALARFQKVKVYGGNEAPNNQKWLFNGIIKKISATHDDTGVPLVTATCLGGAWRGTNTGRLDTYPSDTCNRNWGRVEQIKLSEIVQNILDETYYAFKHEVLIVHDKVFTKKEPFIQKSNDWKALKELSRIANCLLLERTNDIENSENTILFVDLREWESLNGKLPFDANIPKKNGGISFRYPTRSTDELIVPFDEPLFNKDEILVLNGTFDMDVDLNQGSLRIVSSFDEEKGENKIYAIKESDKEQLLTYELKSQEFFDKLRKNDETFENVIVKFSNKLFYNSDAVTQEELDFFFDKVELQQMRAPGYDDSDLEFGGAGQLGFVGYEYTAEIIGDVNIQAYRRYPVYGIGKYSSKPNGEHKFYLRSITHTLGEGGYKQTLNFFR